MRLGGWEESEEILRPLRVSNPKISAERMAGVMRRQARC